jgi:hypothetical protein
VVESAFPNPITISTFTWNPTNQSNNAIIDLATYFQFKAETEQDVNIYFQGSVLINNEYTIHTPSYLRFARARTNQSDYQWTSVSSIQTSSLAYDMVHPDDGNDPNRENYTIELIGDVTAGTGILYIRNVNLVITVIDGLPAS